MLAPVLVLLGRAFFIDSAIEFDSGFLDPADIRPIIFRLAIIFRRVLRGGLLDGNLAHRYFNPPNRDVDDSQHQTYTITSCKPTVTNCPVGKVTTEVFTSYTTYCPDDDAQAGAKPAGHKIKGASGDDQAVTGAKTWGTKPTDTDVWGAAPTAGHATMPAEGAKGPSPLLPPIHPPLLSEMEHSKHPSIQPGHTKRARQP